MPSAWYYFALSPSIDLWKMILGRHIGFLLLPIAGLAVICLALGSAAVAPNQAASIIDKSIAVNDRDWRAQDLYVHEERNVRSNVDANGHSKIEGAKEYQVLMIEGSPYRKLIGVNNESLSAAEQATEERKLQREIARRRAESPDERSKRIGKYEQQRAEEHLLMQQITSAFHFRLLEDEEVAGVSCYRLSATPREDYAPPLERARVLKGMRGTLWIDKANYHWAKVQAEVTQPVSFGFFIARVNPGTRFELTQMPVDSYWLPKHFVQTVNASVFGLYGYRSQDETFYSRYQANPLPGTLTSLK